LRLLRDECLKAYSEGQLASRFGASLDLWARHALMLNRVLGWRFGSGFTVCTGSVASSSPKGRCNIDFAVRTRSWRQPTRQLQRACNRGVGRVGCFVWSHAGVAFLHGSSYTVSRRGTESVVRSNLIFGNMLVFTARGGLLGRGCAHGGKRPRVTTGCACILPRAHH
jgi:acetolactate synthase regulatory subunit